MDIDRDSKQTGRQLDCKDYRKEDIVEYRLTDVVEYGQGGQNIQAHSVDYGQTVKVDYRQADSLA